MEKEINKQMNNKIDHEKLTIYPNKDARRELRAEIAKIMIDNDMSTRQVFISEMVKLIEQRVAKAKRELVEKLVEEVDDWYSLAPAYRNKSELVGKIKSLLLAELSDEEVGV